MKSIFNITFVLALVLISCKPEAKPVEVDESGKQYFGEKITKVDPIDFSTMLSQLEGQDSLSTQLEATVESVCQVKGCWMNLVDAGESEDNSVFVKFKDYGFFMPLDIAGKKVIVEGVAYREVTPVDKLKHYAEDEGKSQEEIDAITEPGEELKFMANGVIIL